MKKLLMLIIILSLASVSLARAVVYTGAMDNRAGYPYIPGFTAQTRAWITGDAADGGMRLEWQVDNESTPGAWTYTYRLLRGVARNKGFAFFDIETAGDFTAANILNRQALSASDRFSAPIPSGLASITISDPANFIAVHDFSNPTLTETSAATALSKSELNHYSGDPGRAASGVPGSPASATPSVGPVPHPFYGIRVTFPGSFIDLGYEACEWEFRVVSDRVPMWGKMFGWGDQTILTPFWYSNFYNDTIDTPIRLALAPNNSLTGAGPYRGWVMVPGPLPGVSLTIPADSAIGVPVTEPVTATFRGIMDAATITTGTFTLSSSGGPVSGTVSNSPAGTGTTFLPSTPLSPNTTYTATITAGVKDQAGNALPAPISWSFTTSALDTLPPIVTATLPGNGDSYMATTGSFSATFSEAINPATLTPATFGVAGVAGTISYDAATRTANFTPNASLANNTTYTATIGTGVQDLAGNPLAAPLTWSITTIPSETVLPYVASTFPAARAVNVVTTSTISATFSETVDPATINASTFFVAGVAGTISYDAATRTATFTPAAPLAFNTPYALTVTTDVRDLAGNPLGLTKNYTFRTLSPLATTFSASGTVTGPGGAPVPGVSLLVSPISQSGTSPQVVVTNAAGQYNAAQLLNGTYFIAPSRPGTVFSPKSISASVTTANVSGLNFTAPPLTVTPNKASPQAPGTSVTFSADVGIGYEYRFYLNDGSGAGFVLQQDYGVQNAWLWTPTSAGRYDIFVEARQAGTTVFRDVFTTINAYEVKAALPPDSVTLSASAASPQSPGTPVTFIAAAQGGSGPYEYRFYLNDGSGAGYVVAQPYGPSDSFIWIPSAVGNYDIFVETRLAGTTVQRDAYAAINFYQVKTAPTSVILSVSPAGPQPPGTPVTFTAAAQGASSPCEYRFYLNDGSGAGYVVAQPYGPSATFNWAPAIAGNYDVFVETRLAGSTVLRDAFNAINFYQIKAAIPATAVSLVSDAASPQATGTPIIFTAAGQGGSGPYEYRFYLNSGAGFVLQQGYSPVSAWNWTPAAAGNYDIFVEVRLAGSSVLRDAYNAQYFYRIQ